MKKLLLLIVFILYNTYDLNAQCNGNLPVMENFDSNNIGVCWQIDDADGDSYNWFWQQFSSYYGGYTCITSSSYNTSAGSLTPDNWIVSYPVDLTAFSTSDNIELSWKVRGELSGFSHEYYTIYVGTNSQISTLQSSSVQRSEWVDLVGGDGTWVTRTMDVSALAGNTVYIAFRHHNSTDQYRIDIDDVSVSTAALGTEDFNKENFKYYYNPGSETLTLKSTNKPISAVAIYNLLGQNVVNKTLSNATEKINLSTLVDGIYIARVEIDNTTKAIKFLKQ